MRTFLLVYHQSVAGTRAARACSRVRRAWFGAFRPRAVHCAAHFLCVQNNCLNSDFEFGSCALPPPAELSSAHSPCARLLARSTFLIRCVSCACCALILRYSFFVVALTYLNYDFCFVFNSPLPQMRTACLFRCALLTHASLAFVLVRFVLVCISCFRLLLCV